MKAYSPEINLACSCWLRGINISLYCYFQRASFNVSRAGAEGKEHARLNVRNEAVLSSWINTNLVSRSRTGQKYTEAMGTRSTRDNQSMRQRC